MTENWVIWNQYILDYGCNLWYPKDNTGVVQKLLQLRDEIGNEFLEITACTLWLPRKSTEWAILQTVCEYF